MPSAASSSVAAAQDPYDLAKAQWDKMDTATNLSVGRSASTAGAGPRVAVPQAAVWAPIGPGPLSAAAPGSMAMNGRVNAIAVNGGTVYLGTAGGGVWKGPAAGNAWVPLMDREVTLALGEPTSIALDTSRAVTTIYVGSSANYLSENGLHSRPKGILKSTDDGATWFILGANNAPGNMGNAARLFFGRNIYCILIDPADPNTLYLASEIGLFRSPDGGLNWTAGNLAGAPPQPVRGSAQTLVLDADPGAGPANRVLWAGVQSQGVFRSQDGGRTWVNVSAAVIAVPAGSKVAVALAPAARAQRVYAAVSQAGGASTFNVSADNGATWPPLALTGAGPTQGGDNMVLAVDPTSVGNANDILYLGAVKQFRVNMAGGNLAFTDISGGIHSDTHVFTFAAGSLYVGNDGGVWSTANPQAVGVPASPWTSLNGGGLQCGLIWSLDVKKDDATVVIAALQDNGLMRWNNDAGHTWNLSSHGGGDGFSVAFDSGANVAQAYGADGAWNGGGPIPGDAAGRILQPGPRVRIFLSPDGGQTYPAAWNTAVLVPPPAAPAAPKTFARQDISVNGIPDGELPHNGYDDVAQFHAITTDPQVAGRVFVSGNLGIFRSVNSGGAFAELPQLRANLAGKRVGVIAVAPSDSDRLAVAVEAGHVWISRNATAAAAAVAFVDAGQVGAGPVVRVAIDPNDATTVYAVLAGFGGGHVFRWTDAGAGMPVPAWQDITPRVPGVGVPLDVPMRALALDGDAAGGTAIYIGTDLGVMRSVDNAATWQKLDEPHFPHVPVTDLRIHRASGTLFAATYGRGAFKLGAAAAGVPAIAVMPENGLTFGQLCAGGAAPMPLTLTIKNVGNAILQISSIQNVAGSPAFTVAQAGLPAMLNPGQQMPWNVTFTPPAANIAAQATIRIVCNDPTLPGYNMATMTASVDVPAAALLGPSINPALQNNGDFGTVCYNTPPAGVAPLMPASLVLNIGAVGCPLTVMNVQSLNPNVFKVNGGRAWVVPPPVQPGGAPAPATITFTPDMPYTDPMNPAFGLIRITTDDPVNPTVDLPVHALTSSPELGVQAPGGGLFIGNFNPVNPTPVLNTARLRVQLINNGTCDLRIRQIWVDAAQPQFQLVGGTRRNLTLAANGGSTILALAFTPDCAATYNGKLYIQSNDPDDAAMVPPNTRTVDLTGTGVGQVNFTPFLRVVNASGWIEYATTGQGVGVPGAPPAWGDGGAIVGPNFPMPGDVLLSPGGGLPPLVTPGNAAYVVRFNQGPLPIFPFALSRARNLPNFGFASTRFGASPAGVFWAPFPVMIASGPPGSTSLNISRARVTFQNVANLCAFTGNLGGLIPIGGFLPGGTYLAVGWRCHVSDAFNPGMDHVSSDLVIALRATPDVTQPNGFRLDQAISSDDPPPPAPPLVHVASVPVVGGFFYRAWAQCFIRNYPGIPRGGVVVQDSTLTVYNDPGGSASYDPSILPPGVTAPGFGTYNVADNALTSADPGSLLITLNSNQTASLLWSPVTPGAQLQTSPNVAPSAWSPVTQTPQAQNGLLSVTVPATDSERFFRLQGGQASLSLALNDYIPGDYASGGVGLRATGISGMASGDIHLTGVPAGAQVLSAYLYWETFGNGSTGTFSGSPITGMALGTVGLPCASLPQLSAYKADVSGLIPTNWPGDTNFTVQLPDSGNVAIEPVTEGASLVVIYQQPGLPFKAVSLYEGPFALSATGLVMSLNLSEFGRAGGSNLQARLTHIVGNGQAGLHDQLFFNTASVGNPSDAFTGAQGAAWDNLTLDVSTLVHAGDQVAYSQAQLGPGAPDCLAWAAAVFSVTVSSNDSTVVPPNAFEITSFSDLNGDIAPFGTTDVPAGTNLAFVATPNAGFQTYQWLLDGVMVQVGGATFSLNNIQSNHQVSVTFQAVADLNLSMSASPEPVATGAPLTYTITVSNQGPSSATGILLTNPVPPGATVLSSQTTQGSVTQTGGGVVGNLGSLLPGDTATVTFSTTNAAAALVTNTASVVANEVDPIPADNVASVVSTVLDLPLIVVPPQDTTVLTFTPATLSVAAASPSPLTYQWLLQGSPIAGATSSTLTFSSAQPSDAGPYSVIVSNAVGAVVAGPALLRVVQPFVTMALAQDELFSTDDSDTGTTNAISFDTGSITPDGALVSLAGDTQIFTATPAAGYMVDVWALDDSVAQVGGTTFTIPNIQADHSLIVYFTPIADLEVSQSVDQDPVPVGTNLTYTISVANEGLGPLTGVVAADTLPSGVTFVSATSTVGSCAYSNGTVTCPIGTLAAGSTPVVLTIVVTPTAAGTLSNTMTATANENLDDDSNTDTFDSQAGP